ncbi:haloalkane dehalogenase [Modestobacter sp. DSM 44400]|uniref:alpha/beta fold hydrolase n=1 Tax=Modestobacter sp. DSM 44400 TaxID=1550230 RepID=UPI00089AF5C9|nr:alpha/beta fold hydrolase [Modestobacter sp. DSM 44400]SDX74546.1 haloalkane dehalogenase [Modestobacter sp. DSM 44400]
MGSQERSAVEEFAARGYDVPVNDTRLHVLDEGEGPPVLLLHGNPTWSYLWRDAIEPLVRAGHRVLVPDQRGFGHSMPMGSPHDDLLEVRVADLAGLVQALGLDEVTLVLHDWGGPIGLAFAAAHPESVRALVVMSTWAWPEPSPFHTSIVPWRMLHAPVVGPHLLGRHNSLADRGVYLSVVDRAGFRERAGRAYAEAMPDPASRLPTVLFPRLIPLDPESPTFGFFSWLQGQLPSLQMPALVIWGREDEVFPPSYADRFVQALGNARGPVLVTGRHFLQEDSGGEIGELVARFLAEVEEGQA